MLLRQRLYGIKVGMVWAIFPDDLEAFKRTRRAPGRPRKLVESALDKASGLRIVSERKHAGTDRLLRKRRRNSEEARRTGTAARSTSKRR